MSADKVFTIDLPQLVFGPGALEECGRRALGLGIRHAALMTDPILAGSEGFHALERCLRHSQISVSVISDVEVEPSDRSFRKAAQDLLAAGVDGVISYGGGSVIDTAKAGNLYASAPADFRDYVNAPVGLGREPERALMPHISCPTTCGTGSECTGIAVFDFLEIKTKTGIMSRKLVPDIAIVDPQTLRTLPLSVLTATALDAMSHALEAYTCRPFSNRALPEDPLARPMTQGANAWSDAIAEMSIRAIATNMRAALDEHLLGDNASIEARSQLMWAASLAGNAFGNAGCHLPHAMSYPISAQVRSYRPGDWPEGPPLIPHGLSVLLTAPACYRLTASGDKERHRRVADWLGADGGEPGDAIAVWVEGIMADACLPGRLSQIGYTSADIPALVDGALPQRRLLDNAPVRIGEEELRWLFEASI